MAEEKKEKKKEDFVFLRREVSKQKQTSLDVYKNEETGEIRKVQVGTGPTATPVEVQQSVVPEPEKLEEDPTAGAVG